MTSASAALLRVACAAAALLLQVLNLTSDAPSEQSAADVLYLEGTGSV